MEATGGERGRGEGAKARHRKGEFAVPFDEHGNLIWWYDPRDRIDWRPNHEFEDSLRFEGFGRRMVANIANYAQMRSVTTDASYPMFMADFADAIRAKGFAGDTITGRWRFVRRGVYSGVRLVEPATDKREQE